VKHLRTIVHIDEEKCDGCGLCIPSCSEGAIRLLEGKARLVGDRYCDGLGACLGECPQGAIYLIEREAEEFDEKAVEALRKARMFSIDPSPELMACGCPSSQITTFDVPDSCRAANEPVRQEGEASELTHWPVKIRLIPPTAPFLKDADLLVAADCTACASPGFHREFLKGKILLSGCPKFDDAEAYVERFTDIFRGNHINSVTVLIMDVPCCQGLPRILWTAMERAGAAVPLETIVIGRQGERL
jgi:ferredoxin